MQMRLPLFPPEIRLFNSNVGVIQKDDTVYYYINGVPMHLHAVEDNNTFRFITATLVVSHLCSPREISDVLGIHIRTVQLNAKALRDKGISWFMNREETRGKCHKYTPELISQAQALLDQGMSYYGIAKVLNVSESSVRYHVNKGTLKKKK